MWAMHTDTDLIYANTAASAYALNGAASTMLIGRGM
jgi:hypothetical protein